MDSTVLVITTDDSDADTAEGDFDDGGETNTDAASESPRAERRPRRLSKSTGKPRKDKKKGKGRSDEESSSDETKYRKVEEDDSVQTRDRGEELVRRRMRQRRKEKKVSGLFVLPSTCHSSPVHRLLFSIFRKLSGASAKDSRKRQLPDSEKKDHRIAIKRCQTPKLARKSLVAVPSKVFLLSSNLSRSRERTWAPIRRPLDL
jgi:hypothetical protein